MEAKHGGVEDASCAEADSRRKGQGDSSSTPAEVLLVLQVQETRTELNDAFQEVQAALTEFGEKQQCRDDEEREIERLERKEMEMENTLLGLRKEVEKQLAERNRRRELIRHLDRNGSRGQEICRLFPSLTHARNFKETLHLTTSNLRKAETELSKVEELIEVAQEEVIQMGMKRNEPQHVADTRI